MATLHWELRDILPELRDSGRLNVLIAMLLHANARQRCYPSLDLLVKETGFAKPTVNRAKEWLIEHGFVVLVPYKLRVDDEKELPRRQNVYQLTGVYKLGDEVRHYLYMTPETFNDLQARVREIAKVKSSTSERSTTKRSTSERSTSELEGNSRIGVGSNGEGDSNTEGKDKKSRAGKPTTKPSVVKEKKLKKAKDAGTPSSPGSGAPSSPKPRKHKPTKAELAAARLAALTHQQRALYAVFVTQFGYQPEYDADMETDMARISQFNATPEQVAAYIKKRAESKWWKENRGTAQVSVKVVADNLAEVIGDNGQTPAATQTTPVSEATSTDHKPYSPPAEVRQGILDHLANGKKVRTP